MTKSKQKSPKFWQKIVIRAVGVPGYGALLSGWVFLLGFGAVALYLWMNDPILIQETSPAQESVVQAASALDVLLMLAVVIAAWAVVAYFCGKIVRWMARQMRLSSQSLTSFKLTLLIIGWLGLALTLSISFPDNDYVFLLTSAASITMGSLSFALEALLFKLWHLSDDATW